MKQRVLPPWQLVSCAGSFPCRAAQARAQLSALSCMEQTQAGSESCASQSAIPNGGPRIAARRNKLSNCRISATIAQEILFRQSLREETGAIRSRSQPRKMPSRIRAKPLECPEACLRLDTQRVPRDAPLQTKAAANSGPYTHLVNACVALLGDKVAWASRSSQVSTFISSEGAEGD